MQQENLKLKEIDRGNLMLQADREIARIIRDIADPNKQAEKERKVVITLKFKPNKRRDAASVKYVVTSHPATHIETESDIYIGKDTLGEPIAKPWMPNQTDIPFEEPLPEAHENKAAAEKAN